MIILIFGVSNVGKTSIGKVLARKLNYSFFDLDEEIRKTFHTTLENFMKDYPWQHERFKIQGQVLKNIIVENKDNAVIAVSPIYHARNFNSLLDMDQVIAVELQDTEEHIFERLVFSDENDNIYEDNEYKEEHREHYLQDIHEDIIYVKKIFQKIQWKYFIDNKSIEEAAEDLFEMLPEKIREKKENSGWDNLGALQNDVSMICQDFKIFCDYVLGKKVRLAKSGRIGKKDCFEINALLYRKEEYEKATRFQNQYPIIQFFYYVAIKYKILEFNSSGTSLAYGRNYQLYCSVSAVEQYVLFLLNFLFDRKYKENAAFGGMLTDIFFDWASDEERRTDAVCKVSGKILGYGDEITPYLEEFRLIKVMKKAQWNGRIEDNLWEIEILPLLQVVADLYEDVNFEEDVYWNKEERIGYYFESYLEKLVPEQKSSPLLKLFEPVEVNCLEQTIDLDVRIRGYDCVRVLRLNLSDSLYSLHNMIQKAFNFDDDHLFEFYLGQGIFQKTYTIPEGQTSGEELSVYETKLGDMELGKGQTFSYLFDFGDSWWFDIKVLQIAEGKIKAPTIIKAEHEPPQQYPEYEEYDSEFANEEYYSEIDEEVTVASILASFEDELIDGEYDALLYGVAQDEVKEISCDKKRQKIENFIIGEPDKMLDFMTGEMRGILSRLMQEEEFDYSDRCVIAKLYSFGFCMFPESGEEVILVPKCIKDIYASKVNAKGLKKKDRMADVSELVLQRCGVIETRHLYTIVAALVKSRLSYEEYMFLIYGRLHYFGEYFSDSFEGEEFMSCYEREITEKILMERQKEENIVCEYPDFENIGLEGLGEKSEAEVKWEEYIKFNMSIDWTAAEWLSCQIPLLARSGVAGIDEIIKMYKEAIHNAGGRMTRKASRLIADLCETMPLATRKGNIVLDESEHIGSMDTVSNKQPEYRQLSIFD